MQMDKSQGQQNILVFGIGGAGVNSVARMKEMKVPGVQFITMGTSEKCCEGVPHINLSDSNRKLSGCGGDPHVGEELALKKEREIAKAVCGQDMLIVSAGMGRGTGNGASYVVADIARKNEVLSAGIMTTPFSFEGKRRRITADEGISRLEALLDCIVVIHNESLFKVVEKEMQVNLEQAFHIADDTLHKAVRGISDLVVIPGEWNIDFADLRTTISDSGRAIIGMGEADGENRAKEAFEKAVSSPLLESGFEGAKRVLLNVTGNHDLTLHEFNAIGNALTEKINNPDANIIVGSVYDSGCGEKLKVSIFATDFQKSARQLKGV